MSIANSEALSLKELLRLPAAKPASEHIDGKVIQKPVLKTRHSRLQSK